MISLVENKSLFEAFGVIYLVTNNINGKVYIGQTVKSDPRSRWNLHKNRAKDEARHQHFGLAIRKHGSENFTFTVIHGCTDQKDLDYWETYYINQYKSLDRTIGYNIREGGARGKHTEETKEKMRLSHTPERKAHMSEIMTGRPLSEEHCRLISEGRAGMTFSDEHRKNISISKSGENSPVAKLNWKDANTIRADYITGNISVDELAKKYNVYKSTIYYIIMNKIWIDPNYDITEAEKIAARNKVPTGERNSQAKLTQIKVNQIRAEILANPKIIDGDLAKKYNISRPSITYIRQNKTWHDPNYIPPDR
jgi:group I intron endonuclease